MFIVLCILQSRYNLIVWVLCCLPANNQITINISCAIIIQLFGLDEIPTSVDYVRDVEGQFVASYNSSHCVIYDIETKSPITRLECSKVRILQTSTLLQ